jgi:multisubunit Na+/H+ antiporter MnhB subunit
MNPTNKERFMYVLGGGIVGMGFTILTLLVFYPLPTENKDIVNIALGTFLGMAVTVVSYFFGSSKSSADKNEMLKSKSEEPKA